jgi:hypothetical protein
MTNLRTTIMWICPRCGEPHQDQFKECWKCVGAEMDEHVTAEPPRPKPPPERRLRSTGSILLRAGIGFLLGMLLSMSSCNFVNPQTVLPGQDLTATNKVFIALVVGAIFGVIVGLFLWVMFPYEPCENRRDAQENDMGETRHFP